MIIFVKHSLDETINTNILSIFIGYFYFTITNDFSQSLHRAYEKWAHFLKYIFVTYFVSCQRLTCMQLLALGLYKMRTYKSRIKPEG